MQEPDETPEQADDFVEMFTRAFEKVPLEDYDRARREAVDEMHAEAMLGVCTRMYLPPAVLEGIRHWHQGSVAHPKRTIVDLN